MLHKHLLDRWSGRTNERFPVPLFDASKLHGLDASAKNVRTENDRYIDALEKHRWYAPPHKRREADAFLQSWNAFITNVLNVGWTLGFKNYLLSVIDLRNEVCPVHVIVCTGCRERQACCASLGATHARGA